MRRRAITLGLLVCMTCVAMAQDVLEEMKRQPQLAANNFRVYPDNNDHHYTEAPADKKPFYLSHYGRHGSRYLSERNGYELPYCILSKADSLGKLTQLGKKVLGEVTVIRNDAHDRHGDLTQPGCEQLRHIARRMVEHFPEVFEGNVVVDAKSTTRRRCILSMGSAIQQIALMRPQLRIRMDASNHDMWYLNHQDKQLRDSMMTHRAKVAFNAYCDKRENMERMMGMLFNDTAYANHEVDRWTLHYYLYKLSAVVRGTILGDNETLSSLFTAEELYQLWQRENAWWYISYGPSLLNGGKQPYVQRHLLRKIIEEADSCITEITPGATLRFGHETVMLGLSCLMGVNGLDYQTMDVEELEQHGWVSYRVFPKGCNLQLVFYRRDPFDKDVIFKVLLNEEEATLPIESSIAPYYRWSDFRAYCLKKLDAYKAN